MIDPNKPVYLRLRETIANAILDGKFGDGDMLPSVRALAAEEGANPLTVAKAYQSFQDDGLVIVRRGVGMFVAEGASVKLRAALRKDFLANVWPPVAQQIQRIGIDIDILMDGIEA
jgi:GntR family transcriptional regulator